MSRNDSSKSWWENPKVVIWVLGFVAGAGLLAVALPLGLSWGGGLSSKNAQFYITEVGVPLLTFAGFLAVYLGFLSQREQNELQKQQLEAQREQIEAQQSNFQKDRFESTFFQLLRTQNQIVNDIRCEKSELTWLEKARMQARNPDSPQSERIIQMNGRACFQKFYSEFESLFEKLDSERDWENSTMKGKVRWIYEQWISDRKSELNHYFSHLAKIISFVHRSDVQDKEFYIDLVTAQMSLPELKLFFYHINLKKGESEHRHLRDAYDVLGEYTFFEQIDGRSLIHDQHYQLNEEALGVW